MSKISPKRKTPTAELKTNGSEICVFFGGDWIADLQRPSTDSLYALVPASAEKITFNFSDLGEFDSMLICALLGFYDLSNKRAIVFDFESLPSSQRMLLDLALAVKPKPAVSPEKRSAGEQFFHNVGNSALSTLESALLNLGFLGEFVLALAKLLSFKARFRFSDLTLQVQKAGPDALGIVGLISFLVGLILAFVGAVQLAKYGSEIYIADLVGLAMTREMGAIMVAIVMAGRTGAAFAAELGSMKVNEEIDAFSTFGISPMEFLVLPRVLALVVMFPLLTIFADLIGVFGGFVIGWGMFDISYEAYMTRTMASLSITQCLTGVGKSLVFGVVIALIGCVKGMNCGRSSEAVGQSTTSSVVLSITSIIVIDAIFAVIFTIFDI